MLTAIFRDRASTERAFDWLQDRGYDPSEINVLMSEHTREGYHDHGTEGRIKTGSHAMEGVAAGGAVGTVVGATVGAILAIGHLHRDSRLGLDRGWSDFRRVGGRRRWRSGWRSDWRPGRARHSRIQRQSL